MITAQQGVASFGVIELGAPYQRTVAKHPKVFVGTAMAVVKMLHRCQALFVGETAKRLGGGALFDEAGLGHGYGSGQQESLSDML